MLNSCSFTQSFLVVQDSSSQDQLLCVSVGDRGEPVKEFPILTTGTGTKKPFHLWLLLRYDIPKFATTSQNVTWPQAFVMINMFSWRCILNSSMIKLSELCCPHFIAAHYYCPVVVVVCAFLSLFIDFNETCISFLTFFTM